MSIMRLRLTLFYRKTMRLAATIFTFFLMQESTYADFFNTENVSTTTEKEALVPGPPRRFEVHNISDISAHVLWSSPASQIDITHYELEAKVLQSYSNESIYSPKWTFSNNIFRSEISNLQPGTKYNVTLKACSKNGSGQETYKIIYTRIGEPDQFPKDLKVIKRDDTTMTVKISPVENNNGPISFYRVVVMNVDQMQVFQRELLNSYDQAMRDGLSYYIAADVKPENINKDFVVGDKGNYNGYYNAPLETGFRYYVFVGIVSILNGVTKVRFPDIAVRRSSFEDSSSEGAGLVIGLAVAVAVASILLIIGVVILVLVRHRFYRNRRQRLSDNQELCVQGPMIQVANQGYIPDDEPERTNHYDVLKRNVWNIPRDCVQVDTTAGADTILGFGDFGHVVKSMVRKSNSKAAENAACYIVTDGDLNTQNKRLMLRKLDVLIKADKHDNLAGLIGTCENPETVYILFEYSSLILKELLLDKRHSTQNGKFTSMNEIEVFNILIGIAEGMKHLECKNLLHEKLCARNIFIFDENIPKITGHGISHYNKDNISWDYSRWTAQEVLNGKPFSVKSDVWSFGCLMWEVCSLGGTPYNYLDSSRFSYEVCRGVRLPKIPYIGEEFYQTMITSWQNDPAERPSFHEILQQLIYFKETVTMYAHLNFDTTSDFSYEVYVPSLEVAQDVCTRNNSCN